MRTRAMERDELHGPWPSSPEVLASEFPDWEIWRDHVDGVHGDWCARLGDRGLRSPTLDGLRRLLEVEQA